MAELTTTSNFEGYDVRCVVESGEFATVFRVVKGSNDEERLLKQVKLTHALNDANELKKIRDSVENLKKLPEHNNILRLFHSFEAQGFNLREDSVATESTYCLYLELELFNGMPLREKISEGKNFAEDQVLAWFFQMASGVKFIHDHGFVHGNLNPQTILLTEDLSTIKLSKFGISLSSKSSDSFHYMAPELFKSEEDSESNIEQDDPKSDVWSLGIVLFELIGLMVPYKGDDFKEVGSRIKGGQRESLPEGNYSRDVRRLIDWLLTVDPADRPSMASVIADPLIRLTELKEEVAFLKTTNEHLKIKIEKVDGDLAKEREENALLKKQLAAVRPRQSSMMSWLFPEITVPLTNRPSKEEWFDAVEKGDAKTVEALVERGADCNAKHEKNNNYTALHYCGWKGYRDIAMLLIENGARVNRRSKLGGSPLMSACWNGMKDVCAVLIEFGADVNAEDNYDNTPLINAAYNGDEEIVKMILENPNFNCLHNKNCYNHNALFYAVDRKHEQVVQLLKAKGAIA